MATGSNEGIDWRRNVPVLMARPHVLNSPTGSRYPILEVSDEISNVRHDFCNHKPQT